jgi:Ca2+:H+ antiporter
VLLATYVCYLVYMVWTHPELFDAGKDSGDAGHGGPQWSAARALGTLLAASAGAAWMSEVSVVAA